MNLYTYHQAARLLSLSGRAVIHKRLASLAARGEPLTVEAGELIEAGERRLITDAGIERLRNFTPRRAGRKPKPTPDNNEGETNHAKQKGTGNTLEKRT